MNICATILKPCLLSACLVLAAGIPTLLPSTSFSEEPSKWGIRVRGLGVIPNESGTLSGIGGEVGVSNTVVPELDITYYPIPHLGIEAILGTTPHDLKASQTALGNFDIGKVWLLPPTITLLYQFNPGGTVRPYAGAGLNYTTFYSSKLSDTVKAMGGTSFRFDDSFGLAGQAGVDIQLRPNLFLNVDVKYISISTDVEIGFADGSTIRSKTDLNPWLLGVGIGWRF
jgi:outer membrane protein